MTAATPGASRAHATAAAGDEWLGALGAGRALPQMRFGAQALLAAAVGGGEGEQHRPAPRGRQCHVSEPEQELQP